MDTNSEKLLLKDEVLQVVGCAIEVSTPWHGLVEKPYENALVIEFSLRKIPFKQQLAYDVLTRSKHRTLVPDLIIFDVSW